MTQSYACFFIQTWHLLWWMMFAPIKSYVLNIWGAFWRSVNLLEIGSCLFNHALITEQPGILQIKTTTENKAGVHWLLQGPWTRSFYMFLRATNGRWPQWTGIPSFHSISHWVHYLHFVIIPFAIDCVISVPSDYLYAINVRKFEF